jgi:hypothetical protein
VPARARYSSRESTIGALGDGIDGQIGSLSGRVTCSDVLAECGGGARQRPRTVTTPPSNMV